MGVSRIVITIFLLAVFDLKGKAQTKNTDTLPKHSYDNFKDRSSYAPSYVVIKSKETGKILYEHVAENGVCITCYDGLTLKADSCFKMRNYSDAAVLYSSAFVLNDDKGKVKHRLSAACCFTRMNDFEKAFDNLNRVVFGAKFRNLDEISYNECYKPLHKDSRWTRLIDGIARNLEEVEQKIKIEQPLDQ
jgi:hypothetical protein